MQSGERLLVQIASYNTNLQADRGLPQDLVDWLAPTLQVASFLSQDPRAPDIVAVGFQELIPLHLGLSGFSKPVIENRNALILSQIEQHAPNKEKYSLIAKVVNVGVALLVYGRDDGVARRVEDVHTQWTGCGPMYMGNKGAVGVRFRVRGENDGLGEVYTFVCAHLTAHTNNLARRIADCHHIVGTLLFPPLPGSFSTKPTTMYSTSHLFFFGDLNFRLTDSLPDPRNLNIQEGQRHKLIKYDQLSRERDEKGSIFIGLREGEFWKMKCTYKYQLGEVDQYDLKRMPAWTDRIMYTTYTDSPDSPQHSTVTNALYTSIPSYTASDHKPIVSVLLLPPSQPSTLSPIPSSSQITLPSTSTSSLSSRTPLLPQPTPIPLLRLPPTFHPQPDPLANLKKYVGRTLDRIIGYTWWFFTLLASGPGLLGMISFGLCGWWRWRSAGGGVRLGGNETSGGPNGV
ncbi:unnamed protein product [Somion occarium]|uniref:Inositol polyphosphate-related phosphatase domain-containing protein n=1 Tax=Somion occarium TaxID=3059160 RepID=A0ABP1DDC3_9APHY